MHVRYNSCYIAYAVSLITFKSIWLVYALKKFFINADIALNFIYVMQNVIVSPNSCLQARNV
jgi:hypothetical protein